MECCTNILKAKVANCGVDDNIIINMPGIFAGDVFEIVVKDRFGNEYTGATVTDENQIEIPKANFPAGIFDVPGTTFMLKAKLPGYAGGNCSDTKFVIATAYDAIELEIIGGNTEAREIGCPIPICEVLPVP